MANVEREPTAAELAEIEAEWPRIEADLVALDAQIWTLSTDGRVSELDRRRVRRMGRRVLAVRRASSVLSGEAVAA